MDMNHFFGTDIIPSGSGDISLVSGASRSQQRVLRMLFTNPGDYVWHQKYGAGIRRYIGATANKIEELKANILAQLLSEESVSSVPPPLVSVKTTPSSIICSIRYVDAETNASQTIQFTEQS